MNERTIHIFTYSKGRPHLIVWIFAMLIASCGGADITQTNSGSTESTTTTTTTVTNGSWGSAALLETDDTADASDPRIAFSANGNAITVWSQSDGVRTNILASIYTSGSGWGAAGLIELDDTGGATVPQIAMDNTGNGIAVWAHFDGTRTNIYSNVYTNGTGWGTPELLEALNTNGDSPQIAMDVSTGNAIAVWQQVSGPRINVYYNYYTAGTGWGGAVALDADNNDATKPQVAIDGSGNAMAVWMQSDGTNVSIWYNRYSSGAWAGAALLESDTSGDAANPQVAINSSGVAVAVWSHFDGIRDNIMANIYSSGTWAGESLIETDNAGAGANPQAVVDSDGNAIAVWSHSDGAQTNIMTNRYTGGSWGSATPIENDNSGNAISPQLAIDNSGNGMAVWAHSDGTRTNIMANRYLSGSWGTAGLIETDNSGAATLPHIAIDSAGRAETVWMQSDGTRTNIWHNRYE